MTLISWEFETLRPVAFLEFCRRSLFGELAPHCPRTLRRAISVDAPVQLTASGAPDVARRNKEKTQRATKRTGRKSMMNAEGESMGLHTKDTCIARDPVAIFMSRMG